MNIDLYELFYRDLRYAKSNKPNIKINSIENTIKPITDILKELKDVKSFERDEIKFSDVMCNIIPDFYDGKNKLSYKYEYVFINGSKGNPNDYVERFLDFDINTLPLIGVAQFLNIKVEKSNTIKPYGMFIPIENKIILCSDYAGTFIHELVHAIDYILGNSFENYHLEQVKNFYELVAELSTVVLCKTYNILLNYFYSLDYLDNHSYPEMNIKDLLQRVALICEYIGDCIKIKKRPITSHL